MGRPNRRTLGAAEVGLAVVLGALTIGALIGSGLARTAVAWAARSGSPLIKDEWAGNSDERTPIRP